MAATPSVPALDRAGADAALASATDAVARASASLVELEAHPGYALLAAGGFTGLSATRCEQTTATVAALHRDLALYRDAVERAHAARGTRSRPGAAELAEVSALLHGDSVLDSEEAIPLHRRGLLQRETTIATRTSPPRVLERMHSAFAAATDVVAAVAAVWDAVATQLGPAEEELAGIEALGGAGEVTGWARRLQALRSAVLTDPLARRDDPAPVPAEDLAALRRELGEARARLVDAAELRAGLDLRVAEVTARIDALAAAESAAAETAAEVARLVVTGPGLPEPGRRAPELRGALRAAHAEARAGRWGTAVHAFADVADRVDAARGRAIADRAVLDGLIERRRELRGRLGALRAKASARGRGEDLPLDALHAAATDLLWSAPCDLAAATVAVRRYQRALETETRDGGPTWPS